METANELESNVFGGDVQKTVVDQALLSPEFDSFETNEIQKMLITQLRFSFDKILNQIKLMHKPENARYTSIVATKLEEALMFAIKGISKP